MDLLHAAILLIAAPAQAEDPAAAWDAWLRALPEAPALPLQQTTVFTLGLRFEDVDENSAFAGDFDVVESFECTARMRQWILDEERNRIEFEGGASMRDPEIGETILEARAAAGLLLDGARVSAWADAEWNVEEQDEVHVGVQVAQSEAESLYLEFIPRIAPLLRSEHPRLDPGLIAASQLAMPASLGAYLHPRTYFLANCMFLQARAFARDGDRVRAALGYEEEFLESIAQAIAADVGEELEEDAIAETIRTMAFEAVLDAQTGLLLECAIDLGIPMGALEPGEDGRFVIHFRMRTESWSREAPEESVFVAPAGRAWLDLDPMLPLARAFLRSLGSAPPDTGDDEEF